MRGIGKKIAVVVMALVGITAISTVNAQAAKKSTQYKMVWSDEFNGTELNEKNWTYDIGNGGANIGWGNLELEYYTDRTDNVKVQNGNLIITAKAEKYINKETGGVYKYTSGRIKTNNLQSFKYGRLEARMKLPDSRGLWPAFWMLGYDEKGWPFCGEIDIFETWNERQFVQGTIHWVNELTRPNLDTYRATSTTLEDKTDWHIYGINWTPKKIEWTLDGKVYKTFELKGSDKSELKKEFYFIINCAVGGSLAYYAPNEDFISDTVVVDYVRVYQRASDNGSYTGTWTAEEKAAVKAYTVKYKNGKKVVSEQKLLEGETSKIPTAKKKGYIFKGWYIGKKKVTEDTRIYANSTIKAKWEKIKVKRAVITSTKQQYKKTATLEFKVKGKADGYEVKVGKKKEDTPTEIAIFGKFKSGKTYKAKVRAYRIDSRGKKIYGKWSKTVKITIK